MKLTLRLKVAATAAAVDVLADKAGLSKGALKDALEKGAVWLKRQGAGERRIRKAKFQVHSGDLLSLYYDSEVLKTVVPEPRCVADESRYSVWFKPAFLLSQGSRYGDHCSLLRYVERYGPAPRAVFLIHRLDREASGLVLLAHDAEAAAAFSQLFQDRNIEKRYRAQVHGLIGSPGTELTIDSPLDDKEALTSLRVTAHNDQAAASTVDIQLHTGRLHQIRRHLAGIGHPLLGDSRYGDKPAKPIKPTKPTGGDIPLQLVAYELAFCCPFTKQQRRYTLPN